MGRGLGPAMQTSCEDGAHLWGGRHGGPGLGLFSSLVTGGGGGGGVGSRPPLNIPSLKQKRILQVCTCIGLPTRALRVKGHTSKTLRDWCRTCGSAPLWAADQRISEETGRSGGPGRDPREARGEGRQSAKILRKILLQPRIGESSEK